MLNANKKCCRSTCICWYKKFDLGKFGTVKKPRSGRSNVLDNNILKDTKVYEKQL